MHYTLKEHAFFVILPTVRREEHRIICLRFILLLLISHKSSLASMLTSVYNSATQFLDVFDITLTFDCWVSFPGNQIPTFWFSHHPVSSVLMLTHSVDIWFILNCIIIIIIMYYNTRAIPCNKQTMLLLFSISMSQLMTIHADLKAGVCVFGLSV